MRIRALCSGSKRLDDRLEDPSQSSWWVLVAEAHVATVLCSGGSPLVSWLALPSGRAVALADDVQSAGRRPETAKAADNT